jgi:hypothetical protein
MLMQQAPKQNMFARFLNWMRRLLASADFQAIEAQAALMCILIGLVFLNPYVHTFDSGRGFAVMASLASESVWGCGLFGVGCIGLLAMRADNHRMRRGVLFLIACLWASIAFTFYISNSNGLGLWLFSGLALSAGWAYWRIALRDR